MCFAISKSPGLIANARRRRFAYKVVRANRFAGIGSPTHCNCHLQYELDKWYSADRGAWDNGDERTEHGMYVFLSLDEATAFKYRQGGKIFKVEVRGFRRVSNCGTRATYSAVRFIKHID